LQLRIKYRYHAYELHPEAYENFPSKLSHENQRGDGRL